MGGSVKDCVRTWRIVGKCIVCDKIANPTHCPAVGGFYCGRHCPFCTPGKEKHDIEGNQTEAGAGVDEVTGYRPGEALMVQSTADCMRSRNDRHARQCDVCGRPPSQLHVPLRRRGVFCAQYYPSCATVEPAMPPAA